MEIDIIHNIENCFPNLSLPKNNNAGSDTGQDSRRCNPGSFSQEKSCIISYLFIKALKSGIELKYSPSALLHINYHLQFFQDLFVKVNNNSDLNIKGLDDSFIAYDELQNLITNLKLKMVKHPPNG